MKMLVAAAITPVLATVALAATVLTTAVFTTTAHAQEAVTTPPVASRFASIFEEADRDGNSNLNKKEAAATGLSSMSFMYLDTDGNGELSLDEFMVLVDVDDSHGSESDA